MKMTPTQQVADVLARTSPGEVPMIPPFLLVKNRRPLTARQQARVDEVMRRAGTDITERVDWRKPRGMPWEEWDAWQAREVEEKRTKSLARVAVLREQYGDRPRAPRCLGRVRSGSVPRTRAAGKAPPAGSKAAMVAELLLRKGGCTTADALAATGWPAISMPAQARTAGLTLRKERVDGVLRYYGMRG